MQIKQFFRSASIDDPGKVFEYLDGALLETMQFAASIMPYDRLIIKAHCIEYLARFTDGCANKEFICPDDDLKAAGRKFVNSLNNASDGYVEANCVFFRKIADSLKPEWQKPKIVSALIFSRIFHSNLLTSVDLDNEERKKLSYHNLLSERHLLISFGDTHFPFIYTKGLE